MCNFCGVTKRNTDYHYGNKNIIIKHNELPLQIITLMVTGSIILGHYGNKNTIF